MKNRICTITAEAPVHAASGLRIMPRDYHHVVTEVWQEVELPPVCCPVSKYPCEGSRIVLAYLPGNYTLEVFSLTALLKKFVGGYPGSACGTYPAERNMEGMVQLICQMASDALQVPVHAGAVCSLGKDGTMYVMADAKPQGVQR